MLSSETKRLIDEARDYLVGVVPNPLNQIEQITYALIYKFMHDMDKASIKVGGEASFFTGGLKKYSWDKLIDSRLGNHDKYSLYSEALEKFTEAKQLPELFRSIYKSAFLPYKAPETLGMFLKVMNKFDYNHPEDLGNAYEYLLSIMSSQGDAGQFRTPRHIIKFMVDVLDPKKNEKILDPACGTGGFLIYSYRHIVEQHDGKDDPKGKEKQLTPDERKKLMQNLEGYDIDPSMVRMSQVNMYLHQFKNPQIFQYDTLTSEDRWGDRFDLILANPPFMSPRGGIVPHNKFSVRSNRAEVLFVDYIMNHLKPKGRAGIIVPEGIIFQNGRAYKELRKNLVENGLYAVVSLPGGVFQPYSGVKTSILLLDNEISKQKNEIAFVKISADGFDLGATKRPISENDLPDALNLLSSWRAGNNSASPLVNLVSKEEVAVNGNYNLSGDRYKAGVDYSNSHWEQVPLGKLLEVQNGYAFDSKHFNDIREGVPLIRIRDVNTGFSNTFYSGEYDEKYLVNAGDLLVGMDGDFKATIWSHGVALLNQRVCRLQNFQEVNKRYVYYLIQSELKRIQDETYAVTVKHISSSQIQGISIPLPPLEVQEQIVAELDGYAAIISGAKQIVENWKPRIDVDPEWEARELGDVCEVYQPKTITGAEILDDGPYKVYGANGVIGFYDKFNHPEAEVAITCRGATCGTVNFTEPESWITGNAMVVSPKDKTISKKFLQYLLIGTDLNPVITGSAQPQITGASLKPFEIPIPPIDEQDRIVELVDAEASQVDSAKKLIETYEARTQAVIAKLWSE